MRSTVGHQNIAFWSSSESACVPHVGELTAAINALKKKMENRDNPRVIVNIFSVRSIFHHLGRHILLFSW